MLSNGADNYEGRVTLRRVTGFNRVTLEVDIRTSYLEMPITNNKVANDAFTSTITILYVVALIIVPNTLVYK